MKNIQSVIATILLAQATSQSYYPNWASGGAGPHVCLSANATETVPSGAPLFTDLEECCSTHYGWNFDACIGNNEPTGKYFPNWGSSPEAPETCLLDDGTHAVPDSSPRYDDLSTCCSAHYLWKVDSCNNAALGPSQQYFPNWGSTPHICLLDNGNNVLPSGAPLYEDRASCCANQYPWNLNECNGANDPPSVSPTSPPSRPATAAPSASSPTTSAPSTSRPATAAPSASNPTTSAPSTSRPTTAAPSASSPTTSAPSPSQGPGVPVRRNVLAETKVTPDGADSQAFGRSVFIHGNFSIVGAPQRNNGRGSAFIYERNVNGTWQEIAELVPSDGEAGDSFGNSIDVDTDEGIIVIGAPNDDQNRGAVYIFKNVNNTWTQTNKVVADERISGGFFGADVTMQFGLLVVGSYGASSLYLFDSVTLEELDDIRSDDEELGTSLSLSNEAILAVGAPGANNETGRVVLYGIERNIDTEFLEAPDGDVGDQFGWDVDVAGDIIAVGAPYHDIRGLNSGAVYIYENAAAEGQAANFSRVTRISASDGRDRDAFGYSVKVDESYPRVYVGAPGGSEAKVYIFERLDNGQWIEVSRVTPLDSIGFAFFGFSLDYSEGTLMIGAPQDSSGSVYFSTSRYLSTGNKISSEVGSRAFGRSVFISGNFLVVGAPGQLDTRGSAIIYERNVNGTWQEIAELVPSDGEAGDSFGNSIDVDTVEGIIVIGAPNIDQSRGAVYFFKNVNNTWTQTNKVVADERVSGGFFGADVTMQFGLLFVGSYGTSSIYLYDTLTLEQLNDVQSDDEDEELGTSLSLSNEAILAVGAPGANNDTGRVVLYGIERNIDTEFLEAPDGDVGDQFGWDVDVAGDIIAVGAPYHEGGSNGGGVYIYENAAGEGQPANFSRVTLLSASGQEGGDFFGYSVKVDESYPRVYVGAPGGRSAAVYIFERLDNGQWIEVSRVTPLDSIGFAFFGFSLDSSGGTIMIGAPLDSGGSVYFH